MTSATEENLLDKLASGVLDGIVGGVTYSPCSAHPRRPLPTRTPLQLDDPARSSVAYAVAELAFEACVLLDARAVAGEILRFVRS